MNDAEEDEEERAQMEALKREEEEFEAEMRKLELEQKKQMELDEEMNMETMSRLKDLETRSVRRHFLRHHTSIKTHTHQSLSTLPRKQHQKFRLFHFVSFKSVHRTCSHRETIP